MSDFPSARDRHLSLEHLDRVLGEGVPYLKPIPGDPRAWLVVTPSAGHMAVRVMSPETDKAPSTRLQHVVSRMVHVEDDGRALEVVVTVPALFRAAYPLLCSIVDQVQLEGMRPADALAVTLRRFAALLAHEEGFAREREIGLFGELLSLEGLIRTTGPDIALAGWRGADNEEHDFGLPVGDVEVKTTTGERRTHWVESLTQLVATPGRPLWLVSHQLTPSGSAKGLSLPSLIDRIRDLVGIGTRRDDLETRLMTWGWDDAYADRCDGAWTRRSPSAVYAVDSAFPRITPGLLTSAGVTVHRLAEVRYRVDLTGLIPIETPDRVLAAVTGT